MTPLKQRGRSDGHIYILRRKIRQTHKYTKGEYQTDTYIPRGKIRRTHKNTKGEDQSDIYIYIYHQIEQQDSTKGKGADQTDTNIY